MGGIDSEYHAQCRDDHLDRLSIAPDPITGRSDVRGDPEDLENAPGKMTIGQMLFVAREIKGLTIRDLETKSGVSNPLISQIESGRVMDPGFRIIVKLAKALSVPLDRLARLI